MKKDKFESFYVEKIMTFEMPHAYHGLKYLDYLL